MLGIHEAIDQALTYVKGVWIRKRYIILSTWLLCPAGWLYVASLPDSYESEARLFVDTTSLLRPLLRGLAVYNNPNEQIGLVSRTLLSRPNVEKIARDADLDITVNSSQEMTELVDQLREEIKLSSTREKNIYTIQYSAATPELAQKIVQITLNEFVESALGTNRRSSDSAEEFLEQQIVIYEQRLVDAEQRLAEFKISRVDRAPGSQQGYYADLQQQKALLEQNELKLIELQSQLEATKTALSKESPLLGDVLDEDNVSDSTINTKYDSRIEALETSLDQLLIRFTENHPDVKKVRAMLDSLNAERGKLLSSLSEQAKDSGSYARFGSDNQNPIYQDLKLSLINYENQIASLTARIAEFKRKINQLDEIIDLVPRIEAEAQGLNRDYDITRQKYEDLLRRKEQAELSRKAEETADDVKFRVIDPPTLPIKPSGPSRVILYTLVTILGFGVGGGLAFLLSQIQPVVLSASQLSTQFGIPVFGLVSDIDADAIRARNRRRVIVFALSSACIIILYMALVVTELAFGGLPTQLVESLL